MEVYTSIGRAVAAAQRFETVLIPVFEFFKMVSDPEYRERTGGYLPAGVFKVPVRNIVKFLASTEDIAPDLEDRLTKYSEDATSSFTAGWPIGAGRRRVT